MPASHQSGVNLTVSVKLLGERQLLPAGIFRLLFTHHMDQLDATYDHPGSVSRLEAEHRTHTAFDGTVILLDGAPRAT